MIKLLFICTHNRCRSILAEAIANHVGQGKFIAASAGSAPAEKVHPLTIKSLDNNGIAVDNLHSKSWDELAGRFMPDVVITVCDNAANEACPLWLGEAEKVHWGLADPSALYGEEQEKLSAFQRTIDTLVSRLQKTASLLDEGADASKVVSLLKTLANS